MLFRSTFDVEGLSAGSTYQFRVTPVTSGTVSTPEGATLTSVIALPPTPPLALYASLPYLTNASVPANRVLLTWSQPTDLSGGAINGYAIESSADGGLTWSVITENTYQNYTYYLVDGLTFGQQWQFRVRAITQFGRSQPGNTAIATISMPADAPSNLRAVANADATITLSWAAPLRNGGTPIYGYEISYFSGSTASPASASYTILTPNTGSTSTSLTLNQVNLSNAGYTYRVRALSAAGVGLAAYTTVTPQRPVVAPRAAYVSNVGNGTVTLNWLNGFGNYADWGSSQAPIGYQIEQKIGGVWIVLDTVLNNSNSGANYTVSGLTNGVSTEFRLAYITTGGEGSVLGTPTAPVVGNYTYLTATPYNTPDAPSGFQAIYGAHNRQVVMTWNAPSETGGLQILGYRVEYSSDGVNYYGLTQLTPYLSFTTIIDRKSTRLNSSHIPLSRMPSSA